MCGIVGYITTQNDIYEHARRGFFRYALMLDTLRGPDSTGVITVSKKFTVNRYKTLSSGFRMATSSAFETEVPNGWCSIGHNRSATSGTVTVENAHPFKFGRISLVHNGTLDHGGSSLDAYDKKLSVDSMNIAKALSEVPAKEASKVLEQIEGDFALVWVDERDRTINMCRNRGRPLHIGFNFDKSFMVFMSDSNHLAVLVKCFNHTSANIATIYSIDTFQHLKWRRGSLRPEVVEFDPFFRSGTGLAPWTEPNPRKTIPTTKTPIGPTEKSSSQSTTSLTRREISANQRAARKWKKDSKLAKNQECDKYTTESTVSGAGLAINRTISAYDGIVPKTNTKGMIESLKDFFDVTPQDLTSFKPEDMYELTPGVYQVVGSVIISGWADSEWEGCINFVPKQQADAYSDKLWLIRPIGLTRNRSIPGCPAILCELIHCDFPKYEEAKKVKTPSFAGEVYKGDNEAGSIVMDPAGNMIDRTQLSERLKTGCVNCSADLMVEDAWSYEEVNDGLDIICEKCKWELKWPIM